MKFVRLIILVGIVASVFVGCQEKLDVGGTAIEKVAGDYSVHYNHATFGADPFGAGTTEVRIYNTSSNSSSEMFIGDDGDFWDYKVKVPLNLAAGTFGATDTLTNLVSGNPIKVHISNGKILEGAATTPSGIAADSIYFEIWFEDLEGETGIKNDKLLVGGFRYTGWAEDH